MFSFISLTSGILFFVYAVRYYFSVLLVLIVGKRVTNLNNSPNNRKNDWWNRTIHERNDFNFDRKSRRNPFVSIHLPIYNEVNVIDRILKACTTLDYKNFEVVVVDDSTDETTEILRKNWGNNPRVKIIHRSERKGFKGGALNEALIHMAPRADYVMILDADFIPPPNIIHRFLWYFESKHKKSQNKSSETARVDDWRGLEPIAVQGYQWHWLNSGENWLTMGVRAEYSGSYMVERVGQELLGSLKMIAGSVFMIKADVLKRYRWATSLTEDWELTLRLYLDGYKVDYTPLIYAPAECPSSIRRLARQRQRWAEGHTFNVKKYFLRVLRSDKLARTEKFEFAFHYSLYYLQSLFFCVGTFLWGLAEYLHTPLPWWTATFGWSLVLTNLAALPLMALTGLFLERRVRKDVLGILSLVVLSYVLAPFQAYSALKGLLERREGAWTRTFKTGKITEAIVPLRLRKILRKVLSRGGRKQPKSGHKKIETAKEAGGGRDSRRRLPGTATTLLVILSVAISGVSALSTTIPTNETEDDLLYFYGGSAALYLSPMGYSGTAYRMCPDALPGDPPWSAYQTHVFEQGAGDLWLIEHPAVATKTSVGWLFGTWSLVIYSTGDSSVRIAAEAGKIDANNLYSEWFSWSEITVDPDTSQPQTFNATITTKSLTARERIVVRLSYVSGGPTTLHWGNTTYPTRLTAPPATPSLPIPENVLPMLLFVPAIPFLMSTLRKGRWKS